MCENEKFKPDHWIIVLSVGIVISVTFIDIYDVHLTLDMVYKLVKSFKVDF